MQSFSKARSASPTAASATCPTAVLNKITEITEAKLKTDGTFDEAKLAAECKTVQETQGYSGDAETACLAKLNEKTKALVKYVRIAYKPSEHQYINESNFSKDCPAPAPEPTEEPETGGSTMTGLSAAVAIAVVLPLLRVSQLIVKMLGTPVVIMLTYFSSKVLLGTRG